MFNILLLGDGAVGKSTFIKQLKYGVFQQKYLPTMGTEITYANGFKIYEQSGQEKFTPKQNLIDFYKKQNIDMIVVMYDVTSRITYKNIQFWIDIFKYNLLIDIPLVICGNKNDMGLKVKTHIYNNIHLQISCKVRNDCLQLLNDLIKTIECDKASKYYMDLEASIPCPYGTTGVECDCDYHSPDLYKD